MKKVLIITYYWPPGAGAGVQRWLKFAKYLREFGWEPVIYTPANPESPEQDPSLLKDLPTGVQVIRRRIREPYRLFRWFTGQPAGSKFQPGFLNESDSPGIKHRLATWLRGNLFIPDARKWWVTPSVRFLSGWLPHHPVHALVSTGPPHSMHLIALHLKKKLGLPWLADFRDPWTQIDFYHKLMLSPAADRRHHVLEKRVLQSADQVVAVTRQNAESLARIAGREVVVVTNGFDPDDYEGLPGYDHKLFTITHLGSMNADRNPLALWKVLQELLEEDPRWKEFLRIRLIGKTDVSVQEAIRRNRLAGQTETIRYLPHDRALAEASRSALLLLPLNRVPHAGGIATGKLYEYLALDRPILCIGPPDGEAARIIEDTGAGSTADFEGEDRLGKVLKGHFEAFLQKQLVRPRADITAYSRRELAGRMAGLLDRVSNKTG